MILKLYSVRDAKAEAYHPPQYARTAGEAERQFLEMVNDEKTFIGKYPQDYDLWYVGEFDNQTGKLETVTPQHVISAVNLKSAQQ